MHASIGYGVYVVYLYKWPIMAGLLFDPVDGLGIEILYRYAFGRNELVWDIGPVWKAEW